MSSNSSPFEEWTTEDVQLWLKSLSSIAAKPKSAIMEKICQFGTDGATLSSCRSAQEMNDILELDVPAHGTLFWTQITKLLTQQEGKTPSVAVSKSTPSSNNHSNSKAKEELKNKQQENAQKVMSLFNPPPSSLASSSSSSSSINSNNGKNAKENIDFQPTIFMNGKSVTKCYTINSSWTVSKLQQTLQDKETGVSSDSLTKDKFVNMDLVVNSKPMSDPNKQLFEYGLVSSYVQIVVITRLKGGAQLDTNIERIRCVDKTNPLIEATNKPDDISYEDSEQDPRALMSCGHAFTAITMYTYIRHCFKKDLQITEFWCPVSKCSHKKPWEWSLMAAVADLNMDEFQRYSNLLAEHQVLKNEIKLCPHCKSVISKPEQISQTRVNCNNCNKSDFCYCCLQSWVGGGLQICGNKNCDTNLITETLLNCEMIKINEKLQMPGIRACPNCLTLVRHVQNCKHMKCPRKDCGIEFCFSCLQRRDVSKGWPCAGAYEHCQAAERQKIK